MQALSLRTLNRFSGFSRRIKTAEAVWDPPRRIPPLKRGVNEKARFGD
jgi:hypothetical protein